MSGFLDDQDDFELARRLRRAAGATPDVYVAYDSVVLRVGAARRRRRLAVTGTAGLVLVLSATSYVLNLRTSDRRINTADATTDVSVTSEPEVLSPSSTFALPSTTGASDGIVGDPAGTVEATTTTAAPDEPETTAPEPQLTSAPTIAPSTDVTAATVESVVTAPAQPATPAPTTTAKPKPPTTKPPVTTPPTVPPTDPPVETTAPPVDTTVPPTVPPTAPPTVPTTVPQGPEPSVPVPVQTRSYTDSYGNTVVASYDNGQLSFNLLQAADGWALAENGNESLAPKKLRATFRTFDGSLFATVVVTVDGGKIKFS